MDEKQFVVFQLDQEEYAVPIEQVREIIHYQTATGLPNTPSYMEGIINLRGKIIPVINLASLFGLTATSGAERKALILEYNGSIMGGIVDQVTEVLRLADTSIESVSEAAGRQNSFITGIGKVDGRLILLLNASNLMGRDETDLVNEAS